MSILKQNWRGVVVFFFISFHFLQFCCCPFFVVTLSWPSLSWFKLVIHIQKHFLFVSFHYFFCTIYIIFTPFSAIVIQELFFCSWLLAFQTGVGIGAGMKLACTWIREGNERRKWWCRLCKWLKNCQDRTTKTIVHQK